MLEKIKKNIGNNIRQYTMVIALIAIVLFFQITLGGVLLKPMNVTNLILQNSYILILAIGMLLCLITGNVDLSTKVIVPQEIIVFFITIRNSTMVESEIHPDNIFCQ